MTYLNYLLHDNLSNFMKVLEFMTTFGQNVYAKPQLDITTTSVVPWICCKLGVIVIVEGGEYKLKAGPIGTDDAVISP